MERFKKVAAIGLTVGMLLSSPAWAAELTVSPAPSGKVDLHDQTTPEVKLTESQKQALEKFYQVMPELKELFIQGVRDTRDGKEWGVSLTGRPQGATMKNVIAQLSFERSTGEMIMFAIRNPKWASDDVPAVEVAKEKAEEFVSKVIGEEIAGYQMNENVNYSGTATQDSEGNKIEWAAVDVQFNRLINGIPLLDSGFRVSVDVAGHVTGFYRVDSAGYAAGLHKEESNGPDPARFPGPSRAISKEEAEKIYAGLIEMRLNYRAHQPLKQLRPGKDTEKTRPVLMYVPSFLEPIDAITGKPLEEFSFNRTQPQKITLQGENRKMIASNPEEASRLLYDVFDVDVAEMFFGGAEVREDMRDPGVKVKEYSWNTRLNGDTEGRPAMRYVNLKTLAGTGQVIGFNLQDDSVMGGEGTVSQVAAQETVVQLMKKYLKGSNDLEMRVFPSHEQMAPSWVDKRKLKIDHLNAPQIHFSFNQTYQGIPVLDGTYSVTVNTFTGRITGFYCGDVKFPVDLPDSKGVVAADAAKAEFLKNHPLRLAYIWPEYFNQKSPVPYLVYQPTFQFGQEYIDAFTMKTMAPER